MFKRVLFTLTAALAALTAAASVARDDAAAALNQEHILEKTQAYMAAIERKDWDFIAANTHPNVNYTLAYSFSGEQVPGCNIVGKPGLLKWLDDVMVNFSEVKYVDMRL